MGRSKARRRSRWSACRSCARRFVRLLPPASVLPALLASHAWAAEFRATPTFSLGQTYTDNVALAPPGQEQSDWVTSIRPGVIVTYAGANLKFQATYRAEILYRQLTSDFELNNYYSGGTIGSLELVPQFIYLDTNTNVTQYNVSAFGAQPLNNINTTQNRTTVRTNSLSPYARYSFGGEANAEVRYTYSLVSSSQAIGQGVDSNSDRIDASLSSGRGYGATTWRLAYSWEKINYDDEFRDRDTTLASIQATVRRIITPTLALVGNLGYEDNNYFATDVNGAPRGSLWNLGFNWTPTPRTSLNASAGHRFYGKTYGLDFSHRTRLTVWNANYSEDVTTTRQQLLAPTQADTATYLDTLFLSRFPDPVARQQAVQDEIARLGLSSTLLVPVNVYTNQVYIQKAFRATAGIQGVFHTIFVNGYVLRRDPQTPLLASASISTTGDFSGELRQTGGALSWSYRITPYTSSLASLGFSRSDTPSTGREDKNRYARIALTQVVGPRTNGSVYYQRQHNDSNVTPGYTENQVAASVEMRF